MESFTPDYSDGNDGNLKPDLCVIYMNIQYFLLTYLLTYLFIYNRKIQIYWKDWSTEQTKKNFKLNWLMEIYNSDIK